MRGRLTLLLTMISRLSASSSMTRFMALRLHPKCISSMHTWHGFEPTDIVGVEDLG